MSYVKHFKHILKEEFKHIKEVHSSRKSTDQYNDLPKKDKKTNNDPYTLYIKLKIKQRQPTKIWD